MDYFAEPVIGRRMARLRRPLDPGQPMSSVFLLAYPIEPNRDDQDIFSLSWFRAGLRHWHDGRTIDASNDQEACCTPE
jgi:hypothetical protein